VLTEMRARFTSLDYALYAGVILFWGFTWIALHYQVGTVSPEVSVAWRFLIAGPVMLAIAAARGESLAFPFSDHLIFVALGFFLFCANFTVFYYAAAVLTSGLLPVVFSLSSVINVALGALVLRTPVSARIVAGGFLGSLGVALMFYPELAHMELSGQAAMGLLLCIAGTLSFCFGNMISARMQKRGLPVFATSGYAMLYGAVLLSVYAAWRGKPFIVEWTLPYLGGLIYLALIGSVAAFACYLTLLGRVGADRAAYATVVMPVLALLVSTAVESYRWTIPALLGLASVLAGNVLVLRQPKKN
jgi:drug/metabolite transporter (DMT)-like permease